MIRRPLVVLALVVMSVAAGGYQYVRALQGRLVVANAVKQELARDVASHEATVQRLLRAAQEREAQYAKLEQSRRAVAATLASERRTFRRLIDENADVQSWADTALPDDVVRLHASAALTGAGDYAAGVRAGDALHVPRDASAVER